MDYLPPIEKADSQAECLVTPISVVVPCFNEEAVVPHLFQVLSDTERALQPKHALHFLFVDDGSTDDTLGQLRHFFGANPRCQILRHERNLGVAEAILNGIRHSHTDIVCSIDSDCTYDPRQIGRMVSMLTDGVDVVVGSPYHPKGYVSNVPGWRLLLSKLASRLYWLVLRKSLCTFTSCFRVYRRSKVLGLRIGEPGYPGVAEILGRLILQNARVVECPTTLTARQFGQSKLKIMKTTLGHFRVLSRLLIAALGQRVSRKGIVRRKIFVGSSS